MFANKTFDESNITLVIVQINIDNSVFAYIENFSAMDSGKNQWVFSIGSVLYIETIESFLSDDNKMIFCIFLHLTNEKDPQLVHLLAHMNEDLSEQLSEWSRLECLLLIMGKYDKSLQFAYGYFSVSVRDD
jgi:hypothetical protein